ncbi:MAG: adenylate/guanylate cyclase domain-containing protein [Chloroflexota bacterium]|nr:adenylate/guanylate cyclase domain-containing protein [Chloroflexota bacterium]
MEPQIRYCTTSDGVSIAYSAMGEGPALVLTSTVLWSHLQGRSFAPEFFRHGRGVGRAQRLVRYDARGTGLSDQNALDFSLDARVRDLETVVDYLDLQTFALCGQIHGCQAAIAYAARHPERLTHLVLWNGYARGEQYAGITARWNSFRNLADDEWEGYTLAIANANLGYEDAALALERAKAYRKSMTFAGVRAFFASLEAQDVTSLLGAITTPTLVMCGGNASATGSRYVEWSKTLAGGIVGARFSESVGAPQERSAIWSDADTRIMEEFLGVSPADSAPSSLAAAARESGTAVILFTDIVDSTALTERLGDTVFRTASRTLDEGMRAAMREAGGTPVEGKVLGDGVMAVFTSASQAIVAARRCIELSAESELRLHVGLHAGDVTHEAGNVYGGAVNIASRICGLAAPGEVLVSDIVRGLARTSAGVVFEDRGEHALKGIDDAVRVYAVRKDGV